MTQNHEAAHGERPRSSSATRFPEDRFDSYSSDRVGSHRVTAQPRSTLRYVLSGLVAAALLTTLGILGVTLAYNTGKLPDLPGRPSSGTGQPQQVKPALDPEASIVILDGTPDGGVTADHVSNVIQEQQLGHVIFAGPAASNEIAISAVFYSNPDDEAAARGLAERLGGMSSYQSDNYDEYNARLTVLLGADYAGPAHDAQ